MATKLFICFISIIVLFSNFAKSSESESIYQKPLGRISQNGPNHIYLTETEESGGQIDNWGEDWIKLKDYAHRLGLTVFDTHSIFYHTNDGSYTNSAGQPH